MDSPLHSGQETVQITEPECEAVYLGIKDYGHDEINKDNIDVLKGSGISGICAVSAIMKAADPERATRELKAAFLSF